MCNLQKREMRKIESAPEEGLDLWVEGCCPGEGAPGSSEYSTEDSLGYTHKRSHTSTSYAGVLLTFTSRRQQTLICRDCQSFL